MVHAECNCGFKLESPNTVEQIIGMLTHCKDAHPVNFFTALSALANHYKDWPALPKEIQLFRYPTPGETPIVITTT